MHTVCSYNLSNTEQKLIMYSVMNLCESLDDSEFLLRN